MIIAPSDQVICTITIIEFFNFRKEKRNTESNMYFFPFMLLTNDVISNNKFADIFLEEFLETEQEEKDLYLTLPDETFTKTLYDLLDLEKLITCFLIDVFRTNFKVLVEEMPQMDRWRIKDQIKRSLTQMRKLSVHLIHPYDTSYFFIDLTRKFEAWDGNQIFSNDNKPVEWNQIFINRISDIHRNLEKLIKVLRTRVLIKGRTLLPTSQPLALLGEETEKSLGSIIESTRSIYRPIRDYLRLINSL
jgi:hypothetical protein